MNTNVSFNEYLKRNRDKAIVVTGNYSRSLCAALIEETLRRAGICACATDAREIESMDAESRDHLDRCEYVIIKADYSDLDMVEESPRIAVVMNVTAYPQKEFRSYYSILKGLSRLCSRQKAGDIAVFNRAFRFARVGIDVSEEAEIVEISCTSAVKNGCIARGGRILGRNAGSGRSESIMATKDLVLPGIRNLEGYLAAAAVLRRLVSDDDIRAVFSSFEGVDEHYQLAAEYKGGRVFSFGKAAMPSEATNALLPFENKINMITGGNVRGEEPYPLNGIALMLVAYVKRLVILGDCAEDLESAVKGVRRYDPDQLEIFKAKDISEAVGIIMDEADEGDDTLFAMITSADSGRDCLKMNEEFKLQIKSSIQGEEEAV